MKKALMLAISSFALLSLISCAGDNGGETPSSSFETSSISSSSIESIDPVYYEVVFLNYDDSFLFKDTVLEGNDAHYSGETPIKAEDDEFTYEFDGWDKDIVNIVSNVTTKATFKAVAKNEGWGPLIGF